MCHACEKPASSLPRRDFLGLLGAGLASALLSPALRAAPQSAPPKPQNVMPADEALARLIKGNQRYVDGATKRYDFAAERSALMTGQNPFAAVLSCSDSRVAPELTFDVSRGDIFVVRVAGNFLDDDGIASLEYAADHLRTPLFVVLGHDRCGAVGAAIEAVTHHERLPGHLPDLVNNIKPAVKAVFSREYDVQPTPEQYLAATVEENVRFNVEELKAVRPIFSKLVEQDKVKVVGAIYRLATGRVDFLDQ